MPKYPDFAPTDVNHKPRFADGGTFMRCKALPLEQAGDVDVAIIGVPFDLGSQYRTGSRHAPAAIRDKSRILRLVNGTTKVAPFEFARIADLGDVAMNPMLFDKSLEMIQEQFDIVRDACVRPLILGGDHTIPLPILRALAKDGPLGLIHFDAHSDTTDMALNSRITHATTFRRAVEEGLIDPHRTIQVGLRSQLASAEDYGWARSVGMTLITMDDYEAMGRDAVIAKAREVAGGGKTYLSFDIDGLDSIYCPGTGVPEPGGYSMRDAIVMLRELRGLDIVAADICEVSPDLDAAGITSLHAAHLGFELLCHLAEQSAKTNA